jgi:hypothetical protein
VFWQAVAVVSMLLSGLFWLVAFYLGQPGLLERFINEEQNQKP